MTVYNFTDGRFECKTCGAVKMFALPQPPRELDPTERQIFGAVTLDFQLRHQHADPADGGGRDGGGR